MINIVISKTRGPVGEWIWQKYVARLQNGYQSQAEFARQLGIDEALLNHYINGRRLPAGENIEKLATLGPEIYDLLHLRRPDEKLDELIEAYDQATDEQKDEIIRFALRLIGFAPKE